MVETRRVVLDTQVALDLLHFDDPRTQALKQALAARCAIVVSDEACRSEWRRVLGYEALQLDAMRRDQLARAYDALVVLHERGPTTASSRTPLPRCADPDDQKFLILADDCGASTLLTRDAALLKLARRCEREGRFSILRPEAFEPPV